MGGAGKSVTPADNPQPIPCEQPRMRRTRAAKDAKTRRRVRHEIALSHWKTQRRHSQKFRQKHQETQKLVQTLRREVEQLEMRCNPVGVATQKLPMERPTLHSLDIKPVHQMTKPERAKALSDAAEHAVRLQNEKRRLKCKIAQLWREQPTEEPVKPPALAQISAEAPASIEELTMKCRDLAQQWKSQEIQRGHFPEAHAKLTERLENSLADLREAQRVSREASAVAGSEGDENYGDKPYTAYQKALTEYEAAMKDYRKRERRIASLTAELDGVRKRLREARDDIECLADDAPSGAAAIEAAIAAELASIPVPEDAVLEVGPSTQEAIAVQPRNEAGKEMVALLQNGLVEPSVAVAHRRIDDTERKEAAAKAAKRVATADAQAQIKRARTEPMEPGHRQRMLKLREVLSGDESQIIVSDGYISELRIMESPMHSVAHVTMATASTDALKDTDFHVAATLRDAFYPKTNGDSYSTKIPENKHRAALMKRMRSKKDHRFIVGINSTMHAMTPGKYAKIQDLVDAAKQAGLYLSFVVFDMDAQVIYDAGGLQRWMRNVDEKNQAKGRKRKMRASGEAE